MRLRIYYIEYRNLAFVGETRNICVTLTFTVDWQIYTKQITRKVYTALRLSHRSYCQALTRRLYAVYRHFGGYFTVDFKGQNNDLITWENGAKHHTELFLSIIYYTLSTFLSSCHRFDTWGRRLFKYKFFNPLFKRTVYTCILVLHLHICGLTRYEQLCLAHLLH